MIMKYIFLCVVFVIIVFLISNKYNTENFEITLTPNGNKRIENILPLKDSDGNIDYLITIVDPDNIFPNHLYKVNNLKNIIYDNKYVPIKNGAIDSQSIIVDLNWHRDEEKDGLSLGKRLMCVGLKYNNNVPEYTIYIKETKQITSKWIEYKICRGTKCNSLNNKNIKSIIYDLEDNLLGVDWKENQIYQLYEYSNEDMLPIWKGPINYDKNVSIHKILFDIEKKMICIDTSGELHIKHDIDWRMSPWKPNNNKVKKNFKLYDIIYDYDGRLIGITDKYPYIMKHGNNFDIYTAIFMNYFNTKPVVDHILSFNDIVMFKTGIDSEKFDYLALSDKQKLKYNKNELLRKKMAMINLNHYLKLKRNILLKCKNFRNKFKNNTNNIQNMDSHIPLYHVINELITNLEPKYNN